MDEAQAESAPQQESTERQTGRKEQHPMHKDENEEEEEEELRSSVAEGKTGCCLSLLTSGASANLGVARFDAEEGVLELLQLPHDSDCSGLEILCEQLTPEVVVTSSRANYDAADAFHQSLMNLKKSGAEVVYLPAKDFNYDGGLNRLLSIAQEVLKRTSPDEDPDLLLHGLIDTEGKEAVGAAGGLLVYLETYKASDELLDRFTPNIYKLQQLNMKDHLQVDVSTLYSLQVLSQDDHPAVLSAGKSKEGLSLLSILDNTKSPLGRKLIRTWLLRPLLKESEIELRSGGVRFFASPGNTNLVGTFHKHLRQVKDVPRIMMRLRQASASVLDWQNLCASFKALDQIRYTVANQMEDFELPRILQTVLENFSDKLHNLFVLIESVVDFPESKLQRRLVVVAGVDEDLDEEKRCYEGLGNFLEDVAQQEVDNLDDDCGDVHLSVVFFPQIGYLVSIPRAQSQHGSSSLGVPVHFSTNEYAYYKTSRMTQLDEELGDISSKISDREFAILDEVRLKVLTFEREVLETCRAAAVLDCILALAGTAVERDWVEPELVHEPVLYVEAGRHPLAELCVETFVPNDSLMDFDNNQSTIQVLTGPNYSGKSVYLKQVALIVYLAHLGSWVPAKSCQVGLTDRIFSRIQSRETCTVSHSSFGIDLNQVSVMLRNSTPRSLLLIDEFGKGTQSTDGVALLASTIAHLDGRGAKCPRTIVATHFHELSLQRDVLPPGNRVGFFTMAVMAENARQQKQQNVTTWHLPEEPTAELVFLYRLVEGKSMSSHGYHCAIKAGMSVDLVSRAQQVSRLLSNNEPIARLENDQDKSMRRRAEAVVSAFNRLDLASDNVRDFLCQVQRMDSPDATPSSNMT